MLEAILLMRVLMPIETINTLAAVGTFVVITATAIAALVQLRHLQASNQLQAMLKLNEMWDDDAMRAAAHYVRVELAQRVKKPGYSQSLDIAGNDWSVHPEVRIITWWEQVGTMVKHGLIQEDPFLDLASGVVSNDWDRLGVPVALMRRARGPALWENFEYLAARGREFTRRYPQGSFPSNMQRLPLPDVGGATPAEGRATTSEAQG
jgi:hypothetical protein